MSPHEGMPPLGIEPRYLWDERRMLLLGAAIKRYQEARLPYPSEWAEEYNELLRRFEARQEGR